MKYLSVCSGIEAASAAWHSLGWNPFAFSEIEPFPCAVLAHRYPDVSNFGDMNRFKEWPNATLDLLVGGTPCQSFSIAGMRKGLDDPRGNLMLTYLAIAQRYRPRWLVWENVPGVLSSNGGRDFGTLLGGMAELGYGFAYRVLDAQYVRVDSHARAVPQRRRRVFVVGHFGDWRRAAAVLFERESLSGNPAPSREARQDIAGTLTCSTFTGSAGGGDGKDGGLIPSVSRALTTSNQRLDAELETLLVAHALPAEAFDASEDGTGRGTPIIPVHAIQAGALRENTLSGPNGVGVQEGIAYTLEARAEVQAVAFDCKASGQYGFGVGEVAPTLRTMGHVNTRQTGGGQIAVAFSENIRGEFVESEISRALQTSGGKPGQGYVGVRSGMQVRRLTPRECERLQGYADDYTLIPIGKPGKFAADGVRYRALGNSMAVNVMRWIGQRISMVDSISCKALELA